MDGRSHQHLPLGAALQSRICCPLPFVSQTDKPILPDGRDLYQGEREGSILVSSSRLNRADDRFSAHSETRQSVGQTLLSKGSLSLEQSSAASHQCGWKPSLSSGLQRTQGGRSAAASLSSTAM